MNATEQAKDILASQRACVLATSSLDGKPEAATIYFAEEGFNLYFETFATYRKYANLTANPRASVVVNNPPLTLQMDGTVHQLSGADTEHAKKRLMEKRRKTKKYDEKFIFFKFMPTRVHVMTKAEWPPTFETILGK